MRHHMGIEKKSNSGEKSNNNLSDIQCVLVADSHKEEVVDRLLTCYLNIRAEYKKHNWKNCMSECGQAIECLLILVENRVLDRDLNLSSFRGNFDEKKLSDFAKAPDKQDEYRLVLPRALFFMMCIRNKRGAIHVSGHQASKMDAQIMQSMVKWCLSEIFRLSSKLSFEETTEKIESIMSTEIEPIWDTGRGLRISEPSIKTPQKVLRLLYEKNGQSDLELLCAIDYKNKSRFKKILKGLHRKGAIDYRDGKCVISPTGMLMVESAFR